MAIQVSGTTVIDDSRNLTNITSVDATTVASISAAGVGGGGTHDFVASGAISNGDVVILNSDGTVTVAGNVTIPQSIGSRVAYEPAYTERVASVHDPISNRIVITYADGGNSYYGTAVVGTVSGNSISFGTPVVFESASISSNETGLVYDAFTEKVIAVWAANSGSNRTKSSVLTVSGTSVSFGATNTVTNDGQSPVITSDPTTDKILVAYRDLDDVTYQQGFVVVGTVSGTTITYGSPETIVQNTQIQPRTFLFDADAGKAVLLYTGSSHTDYTAKVVSYSGTTPSLGSASSIATATYYNATFDPVNNKVIAVYRDNNNSNYGTARVGTVSGTSITFGTASVFYAGAMTLVTATYGTQGEKAVVFYRDSANENNIIEGVVSGTSISFNSPVTFDTTAGSYYSSAYDSTSDKVVFTYAVWADSSYATVAQYTSFESNITNSNIIGVAAEAISDTVTGQITITSGINEGQTGLTIGQSYFVSDDGTLTTTNNGRKIGEAFSATNLQVKMKLTGDEMNAYLGGLV